MAKTAIATPTKSSVAKTTALEQHPLAQQVVPGTMSDVEFDAFCDDLKSKGQKYDIILYEGKVLDGMHRYRGCVRNGMTPKFKDFEGNEEEAIGLLISLNVMRRKSSTMQRALAGARLNIDYGVTQDEAAKRVGVSKVHVSLVAQALRSKNARIIKLLESSEMTREQLHETLVEANIVKGGMSLGGGGTISAAGAAMGMSSIFAAADAAAHDADDDLLGDDLPDGGDADIDDMLGEPPTAGGRVLDDKKGGTTEGGMPTVGSRPGHPERRPRDTPAFKLAEAFKGLPEADQISFMQIAWPVMRKLLKAAGLDAQASPATMAGAAIAAAAASSATGAAGAPQAPAQGAGKAGAQAPAGAAAGAGKPAKPAKPAKPGKPGKKSESEGTPAAD